MAAALHFGATLLVVAMLVRLVESDLAIATTPLGVGILGVVVAVHRPRRPILRAGETEANGARRESLLRVRARLEGLTTERGRRIAAGAIARAAPLWLEERVALREAERHVEHALHAVETERVAKEIVQDVGGFPYRSSDWIEQNANLFRFMKIEKVTMFLILALIVLVAALNIVSTLILLAMEKRHHACALLPAAIPAVCRLRQRLPIAPAALPRRRLPAMIAASNLRLPP